MALIVAVHGIGQQFKADTVIHSEWLPSLRGGLHLAGGDMAQPSDLACAFYGNLFRNKGTMAAGVPDAPLALNPEEIALLNNFWQTAADIEPNLVLSPAYYNTTATMVATPQSIQRALNALAKSSFFAGIAQHFMTGDLKQVVRYFNDPSLRENAVQSVLGLITAETKVVVGHSLGSVVAYEALCRDSQTVKSFVSIGSPLGIPNLIFDRLKPPPKFGVGHWPGGVHYWTNIADKGDVVANPKKLQPLFGGDLKDLPVSNGSDAHHGERYLTAVETGAAILQGLNTP